MSLIVNVLAFQITGGSLNVNQVTTGDITWFNMWNSEMSEIQLKQLETCSDSGNVVAWGSMSSQGSGTTSSLTFGDLPEHVTLIDVVYTEGTNFETYGPTTELDCYTMCIMRNDGVCFSFRYL